MVFKRFLTTVTGALLDRGGNFAMVTTLMLFPMIAMTGLSIDLWSAYETKSRLDEAADAAAIEAISMSSKAYVNALDGAGKFDWDREAERFFIGEASQVDSRLKLQAKADVQRVGSKIVSVVNYDTALPTAFMRIAGFETIPMHGQATAEFEVGDYYNIHILLDNSPSMGLGATQQDINTMNKNVGCAFACHDLSKLADNYEKVRSLSVQLRIDVVVAAVNKLADTISNNITQKILYKIGLFSVGPMPVKVSDLTNDMEVIKTSLQKVQLVPTKDSTVPSNYGVTDINTNIKFLNYGISRVGDGSGVASAKQVLLLITDGMQNSNRFVWPCNGQYSLGTCVTSVDTQFCKDVKKRGIEIAILHTLYLPVPNDSIYRARVAPIASTVAPALMDCASPGLYLAVDLDTDMFVALNELFYRAVSSPRLTN